MPKKESILLEATVPENKNPSAIVQVAPEAQLVQVPTIDYSQDEGAGLGELGARDLALPFIVALQKGNPQVDESSGKGKFISEARAGMLYNSVTNALYEGRTGVQIIPCGYQKTFVEWHPRESGGGLVGHLKPDSQRIAEAHRNERNLLIASNGNILTETAYHYVMCVDPEFGLVASVLAMSSTQLKKSRRWNSLMSAMRVTGANGQKLRAPSFAHIWRLTTTPESNDKGSWWGLVITSEGLINDSSVYQEARRFSQAVSEGKVQVTAPPSELADEDQEETVNLGEEKVPF
jgi:hypothetical protein